MQVLIVVGIVLGSMADNYPLQWEILLALCTKSPYNNVVENHSQMIEQVATMISEKEGY